MFSLPSHVHRELGRAFERHCSRCRGQGSAVVELPPARTLDCSAIITALNRGFRRFGSDRAHGDTSTSLRNAQSVAHPPRSAAVGGATQTVADLQRVKVYPLSLPHALFPFLDIGAHAGRVAFVRACGPALASSLLGEGNTDIYDTLSNEHRRFEKLLDRLVSSSKAGTDDWKHSGGEGGKPRAPRRWQAPRFVFDMDAANGGERLLPWRAYARRTGSRAPCSAGLLTSK